MVKWNLSWISWKVTTTPHSKAVPLKQVLRRRWSRIILRTLTGHSGERGVVDLVEDSLGASSMCWEPILSVKHIYTGDKQGASTLLKSAERTVTRTDCSESFMSVVCSVRDTVGCVWSTLEDSKSEKLWLECSVRRACWQWPVLLILLGQDCIFLVDEGRGLPTTEPAWGYSHTCSQKLPGVSSCYLGASRGTEQKTLAERGQGVPGVLLSESQTEGSLWPHQRNQRWESPEMEHLSRTQEVSLWEWKMLHARRRLKELCCFKLCPISPTCSM